MPDIKRLRAPYVEPPLFRRLTGRWRALPSVVIVGAHASGTTSMYTYLGQHSLIHRAKRRELHYFSMRPDRPVDWYRGFFPMKLTMALGKLRHGRQPITLECSPTYMFRIPAMQQLSQTLPDIRIIAVLRNPVDRAHSGYSKAVRDGWETRTFEESLVDAERRLDDEWRRLSTDRTYGHPADDMPYHLLMSQYGRQVAGWLKFFDPQRLLVIQSEAMFGDPQGVYDHTLNWLGMPPAALTDARAFNVTGRKDPIEPATRARLTDFFAADVAELHRCLGAQLDWFTPAANEAAGIEMVQPDGCPVTIRRTLS